MRAAIAALAMAILGVACASGIGEGGESPSATSVLADPTSAGAASVRSSTPGAPPGEPVAPVVEVALRYGTVTERSVDIGVDGRNTTAAVAGIQQFAIDLYHRVRVDRPGNFVISPYSVTFALGMIAAGARGDTAAEMEAVLHADEVDDWHEGINAYELTLDARTAGSPTTWTAANKVWVRPGLSLRDQYLDVLSGLYGSPLAEADFVADADGSRRAINGWVKDNTAKLIPELFPEGSIEGSTVMVLVNAVALDAPWEFPFDPKQTRWEPFRLADGASVEVPMMHYDEYLPAKRTPAYQAVELPYGGGALSMVIVVPTDLAAFEAEMTSESLAQVIASVDDGGIHLRVPKWSDRTHLTMNELLSDLGMPTAFGSGADFSGMVDGGGLMLGRVEHEAFVEVDEEGTRAAAATGGAMLGSHGPTIDVDRPGQSMTRLGRPRSKTPTPGMRGAIEKTSAGTSEEPRLHVRSMKSVRFSLSDSALGPGGRPGLPRFGRRGRPSKAPSSSRKSWPCLERQPEVRRAA